MNIRQLKVYTGRKLLCLALVLNGKLNGPIEF